MADKKPERRGLGRGLSALMADVAPVGAAPRAEDAMAPGVRTIAVEKIRPNPNQPRKEFARDKLADLTKSIREKGIIQPLLLRKTGPDVYEIVAGERRWRAAQSAQLHEVPALVRDYDQTEVLEIAIIENIQRTDLNPLEEATGYRQLMDRFSHTQEKISAALGKSRSHIANLLRLLTLPASVQDMIRDGSLSAGHARALVTAENPAVLARKVVSRGLSVRETEALVKSANKPRQRPTAKDIEKDADTLALERDLSASIGMKIVIDHPAGQEAGQLKISYKSLDDLDRLCNLLTGIKKA